MKRFILVMVTTLSFLGIAHAENAQVIRFSPIHYVNPFGDSYKEHYKRFEEGHCSLDWQYGVNSEGKEMMLVYYAQAPNEATCEHAGQLYGQFEGCHSDDSDKLVNNSPVCGRTTRDDELEVVQYHRFDNHLEVTLYPKDKSKGPIDRYFSP